MELKDKIVLVTGGAIDVGRQISLEMAEAGAILACHYYHSEQAAQTLKETLTEKGKEVYLFKADLQKVAQATTLIENVIKQLGTIDVLVNNAAIFFKTPFGEVEEKEWEQLLALNLKAPFFLSQAASREMLRKQSGKIINIGDSGALHPFPSYLPYSISKAGIMALTRGLAKALAPTIQVNCVNPGPVLFPEDFPSSEKKFAIDQTLLKRVGTPQDVAKAVRFLIENDYITGECLAVDGGRHIR